MEQFAGVVPGLGQQAHKGMAWHRVQGKRGNEGTSEGGGGIGSWMRRWANWHGGGSTPLVRM